MEAEKTVMTVNLKYYFHTFEENLYYISLLSLFAVIEWFNRVMFLFTHKQSLSTHTAYRDNINQTTVKKLMLRSCDLNPYYISL